MLPDRWRPFLCKLVTLFFLQGYIKSTGVLLEDTVRYFHSEVYLVGLAFSLVHGLSNFLAPLVSKCMDFVCHRTLVIVGAVLTGSGLLLQGLFARHVWHLFACNSISGIGFALISLPTTVSMAKYFHEASEYAAVMGMNSLLSNLGLAVLPIFVENWREQYGMTWSVVLLGTLLMNTVPFSILFPLHSPHKPMGYSAKGEATQTISADKDNGLRRESMIASHPYLLAYFITRLINFLLNTSWAMFLVPYVIDKGFSPSTAVHLSTVAGVGIITGKVIAVVMFYFDNMNSLSFTIPPVLSIPMMFVLYLFSDSFIMLSVITFIVAAGLGVLNTWSNGFVKAACCRFHFKEAASWASTVSGIGSTLAGFTSGLVYNIRGQYSDVFILLASLSGIATVTMAASIVYTSPNPDCDL